MFSKVMVCLLIIVMGAVPSPVNTNASALHIYPKATISNINQESPFKLSLVSQLFCKFYTAVKRN